MWKPVTRVATWLLIKGGPRLRVVVLWLMRQLVRGATAWQEMLQVRVIASTMVLGIVATTLVGVMLSGQVAERLLDARREQAFRDAGRAVSQFQAEMNSYSVSSSGDLTSYIRDALGRLDGTGGDSAVGVALLKRPNQDDTEGYYSYNSTGTPSIPADLRSRVAATTVQQSRSISLDGAGREPGLIVGSRVSLPGRAGQYELYFVMTLGPEQRTLDAIQRVVAIGMASLVLLLGVIAWLITRQVVQPVKDAARVAERLSEGSLDERMSPGGRDELARLAASFNDMADSLQDQIEAMEELSRLQRRFVSDVSHELRTPLTTIQMAAEVIQQSSDDFPPAVARSSQLLITQLDRFEGLLADLLEISRIDAGAAALDIDSVDLGALVRRVRELALPLVEAKRTELHLHLPAGPAVAQVDARRVERIVRNLVVNAVEHSEGRPVEVWVEVDERTAAVLVVDHGVGLRPGDAERVFDRFWRADPARARTTGGTGLGLAISLEDAHLHGGSLRAWGRPGVGTRFLLVLPRQSGDLPGRSPLPLAPPGESDEDDLGLELIDEPDSVDEKEAWLIRELAIDKPKKNTDRPRRPTDPPKVGDKLRKAADKPKNRTAGSPDSRQDKRAP